jgi:ABC-2 type transport system ATP-binding protein
LCDHIALIHQSKKILDGSVQEVREKYRTFTYEVTHSEGPIQVSDSFTLLDSKVTQGHRTSLIQLNNSSQTNQLLQELMNQTTIFGFEEKIPSMQDIFIEAVEKNNHK